MKFTEDSLVTEVYCEFIPEAGGFMMMMHYWHNPNQGFDETFNMFNELNPDPTGPNSPLPVKITSKEEFTGIDMMTNKKVALQDIGITTSMVTGIRLFCAK